MKTAVFRAGVTVVLGAAALAVWWPLWFLVFGALTPADELAATIGPALGQGTGQARWQAPQDRQLAGAWACAGKARSVTMVPIKT